MDPKTELRGEIRSDSDITSIVNSEITTFESNLNLGGTYVTIGTTNTLSGRIDATEGDISTIQNAGYVLESEVDGKVATATQSLENRVTQTEAGLVNIDQRYTVGFNVVGEFTGFELKLYRWINRQQRL